VSTILKHVNALEPNIAILSGAIAEAKASNQRLSSETGTAQKQLEDDDLAMVKQYCWQNRIDLPAR